MLELDIEGRRVDKDNSGCGFIQRNLIILQAGGHLKL